MTSISLLPRYLSLLPRYLDPFACLELIRRVPIPPTWQVAQWPAGEAPALIELMREVELAEDEVCRARLAAAKELEDDDAVRSARRRVRARAPPAYSQREGQREKRVWGLGLVAARVGGQRHSQTLLLYVRSIIQYTHSRGLSYCMCACASFPPTSRCVHLGACALCANDAHSQAPRGVRGRVMRRN